MTDSAGSQAKTSAHTKICSQCGLCMVKDWSARQAVQSCVFTAGWLGASEQGLFGRERSCEQGDEMRFGISRRRFVAVLKQPLPNTQFSGIITRIAHKAFESGMVDAVATLHRSDKDYFFPRPVLARSAADIAASGGSKPVLAQVLASVQEACRQGIKRLLVIGTPCQIHNLRNFKLLFPHLQDIDISTIGIPCTDNANPKKFRWMLRRISRSHKTARHIEYMQDFTIHIQHADGSLERVPFFSLPQELTGTNVFPESCLSCFDYLNSLADITVGYLAAPLDAKKKYQWVIVRTEKGEALNALIAGELETLAEESAGERATGIMMYVDRLFKKMELGPDALQPKGRLLSLRDGRALADMVYETGPRGLEFARYAVDMHLIRNYYHVKTNYPDKVQTLVPKHVYKVLEEFELPL